MIKLNDSIIAFHPPFTSEDQITSATLKYYDIALVKAVEKSAILGEI